MYYQNYEDYMRSILGYPVNAYDNYSNIQFDNYSYNSPRYSNEILNLYPDIYKIINPMVCKICDSNTKPITEELVDKMTEEIYLNIESDPNILNNDTVNIRVNLSKEAEKSDRQKDVNNKNSVGSVKDSRTERSNTYAKENRISANSTLVSNSAASGSSTIGGNSPLSSNSTIRSGSSINSNAIANGKSMSNSSSSRISSLKESKRETKSSSGLKNKAEKNDIALERSADEKISIINDNREYRQNARNNYLRDLIKILILNKLLGNNVRPPRPTPPRPNPPRPPFPGQPRLEPTTQNYFYKMESRYRY